MGKIFGICDNPVSIPTTPFEPIIPAPAPAEGPNFDKFTQASDKFVSSAKAKPNKNINRVTKFLNRIIKTAMK